MKCVECEEVITNPLCAACVGEGVQQWLGDERNEALSCAACLATGDCGGETACVRCGQPMGVCTYCVTKGIFEVVKSHPLLLSRYLAYFNFDLGHMGWEREAREILTMHGLAP